MTTRANNRGRGADRTGRSKKRGKFVALGDGLLTSEAWRSLSGSAIRYYIELRRRYNGINNGDLHLSLDEAKSVLRMGKATALKAQQELEKKGFIRKTKQGGFHQRLATTWALTDESTAAALPTHAYKNWKPESKSSVPKQNRVRSRNRTDNVVQLAPSVPKQNR